MAARSGGEVDASGRITGPSVCAYHEGNSTVTDVWQKNHHLCIPTQ
jgi:hypothetical protein